MTEKVTWILDGFHHYEFNGEDHIWIYDEIAVKVTYKKDIHKMKKAADKLIAKEIVKRLPRNYRASEWKYFNWIDSRLYETATKKPRKKNKPIIEYTDLFGKDMQIMSDGTERIKPIPKDEEFKEKQLLKNMYLYSKEHLLQEKHH